MYFIIFIAIQGICQSNKFNIGVDQLMSFSYGHSMQQDLLLFLYLQIRKMFQDQSEVSKWQLLKELCIKQSKQFQQWQKEKDYQRFHHSHYDWWAFPINRRSSYGDKYKLSYEDRDILIKDQQFLQALRTNAILVCQSWGFDLVKGEENLLKEKDQRWQDWPIRLYKLANSLQFFSQKELFFNAIKFGLRLIRQGNDFTYGPKNLKPLFFMNEEKLQLRENGKKDAKNVEMKITQKELSDISIKRDETTEKIEENISNQLQSLKLEATKNQTQ